MNWLAKYILKKKLKTLQRTVLVSNFEAAKKAIILYNADDKETEEQIRNFSQTLSSRNIKTTLVGYQSKKNTAFRQTVKAGHFYLDKKAINFLGAPKSANIKNLIEEEFDLLFDFNKSHVFPLKYISTLSKSTFKISWANAYQKKYCDLTFELKENNINELIEQVEHYLPMMHKKEEQ